MEVKIYLRCTAVHPTSSIPCGICLTIGESPKEIDYDELVSGLNLNALADALKVPRDSLEIITPEEYASEFDEGEEKKKSPREPRG